MMRAQHWRQRPNNTCQGWGPQVQQLLQPSRTREEWPNIGTAWARDGQRWLGLEDIRIFKDWFKDYSKVLKGCRQDEGSALEHKCKCSAICWMRPRVSTVRGKIQEIVRPHGGRSMPYGPHVGLGFWFDLFWSCFHLVWYCEKWIEMAGRARWQTIWMMTLHYGSVSLAAMLLMFADLMDLNGHILRLVDVLDIQTSSISSWFVFLRPLRTSTLRSLVTWLQKDRRQVEGHFDIKTKHLQHFAIILPILQLHHGEQDAKSSGSYMFGSQESIFSFLAVMGWIH